MSNLADQPASDSASDSNHVGDMNGNTHRADNLSSGNPPEDMKNEEFLIENPIIDLLDAQINQHENILGNRWLERGTVATIVGPSGVGKSMVAVQICVEAAAGVEVFGMRVPRPLRVLLVQSEDSKNDRIEQVQCIRPIALSQEQHDRVRDNFRIVTTQLRSEQLFEMLEREFRNPETGQSEIDLFILNPAFAYVEQGRSVNDDATISKFLRTDFESFLRRMRAGGIVIHHVPKPPRRGTAKRSVSTTQYSAHGSAEWTNAPRAAITLALTCCPYVFEFTIGKRGSKSGWKADGEGYYIRYFAHSLTGPMHWLPATEAEIAAAQQDSGLSDEDLFDLFSTNHPDLSREAIRTGLERAGFEVTEEQLDNMLDRLQGEDKLIATEIDGKTVYRTAKSARRAEKKIDIREAVFEIVLNAGGAGILTTEIRDRVPFGSGEVGTALAELLNLGRIRFEKEGSRGKRYFASLSPVVFVAD